MSGSAGMMKRQCPYTRFVTQHNFYAPPILGSAGARGGDRLLWCSPRRLGNPSLHLAVLMPPGVLAGVLGPVCCRVLPQLELCGQTLNQHVILQWGLKDVWLRREGGCNTRLQNREGGVVLEARGVPPSVCIVTYITRLQKLERQS
jgi:hypothetical protein